MPIRRPKSTGALHLIESEEQYTLAEHEPRCRHSTDVHLLPVSKARTNKFYICLQCTYIVYL